MIVLPLFNLNMRKIKNNKFVEIGVLDGGSLFMWRDYLGKDAEIIGIDLNPDAKRWEKMVLKSLLVTSQAKNFGLIFIKK